MQLPFQQVDVFTQTPLQGNPLAVFWLGTHTLDTQLLQCIAREMNLSETIFVTDLPDPNHAYTVRIFTTEQELPFAGHPTIGAFYVLQRHGYLKADGFQLSPAGVTRLSMDSQHMIWFSPPRGMVKDIDGSWSRLAAALSLDISLLSYDRPPMIAGTGLMQLMVPLSQDRVAEIEPDFSQLALLLSDWHVNGVYIVAQSSSGEYHARFFGGGRTITEDPATGSAAAAWGTYLLQTTGATTAERFLINQGEEMGRPSQLWVRLNVVSPGSLEIGGHAVPVIAGTFSMPD
ncbi:MAG: PhzF family phenazine biosynthesis protein [Firmicutes bacterium]|nr:PhzF family phenazine biosynthesis protein [Bacillota bacterium]